MADQKKVVYEYLEALLMDPQEATQNVSKDVDDGAKLEGSDQGVKESETLQSELNKPEPEPEPQPELSPKKEFSGVRCILVDVHGLQLAIPMDDVEGAQEISSLTMAIDMRHDWIIGQFGPDDASIHVVDTGCWIIPNSYSIDEAAYTDVLILKGRKWALACNQIIKSIDLPTTDININLNKDSRAWLYGTCLAQRCAILDTAQLLDEFEVMII